MVRYLFVINPVAGGTDKAELIQEIKKRCHNSGLQYTIYQTTGEEDLGQIALIVDQFKPHVCIISGGDGTINMLTPLLLNEGLTLGIIPAGSANGLAKGLGIDLENAMNKIFSGTKVPVDVIKFNDKWFMLHLADLGLNAALVKRYKEEGRRGFWGYAISALKVFSTMEELFRITIEIEGQVREFETKFLVIANARAYGTGYQVNPKGKLNDQKVELCVLKEPAPRMLIANVLRNEIQKELNPVFDIIPVNEAVITCNKKVHFQYDGEYHGRIDKLTVNVLKNQLHILM